MSEIDKALQELDALKEVRIVTLAEGAALMAQDTSAKIESGFRLVDECMDGGFREGDFTIVSGIPGEGKTTFCRMLTLNMAEANIPTLWFSHEMTISELWESFKKMGAKPELISYAPVELNDDIDWMFARIDQAIEQFGVKAVFIDTLGDIVKSVKRQQDLGNYATYLAQICKDLRHYAIQKNIMIFAVAHAVKNTRSKTNETDNADIANSNGIAAAATNIFHVWREEEGTTMVKVGKSRRDGTKKGWRIKFNFKDSRLVPVSSGSPADKDTEW